MGRSLNYGRKYGSTYARFGARRHPNVSSGRGIPPAEALAVRIKLARLKREAERRRNSR
jgi:hypothetical protein